MVIGTSLQVYPAAGLIDSVDDEVPKYIIDKKIPAVHHLKNVTLLEATASEGVERLIKILKI